MAKKSAQPEETDGTRSNVFASPDISLLVGVENSYKPTSRTYQHGGSDASAIMHASPRDICLAALDALEIRRTLPEWFY